MKILIGFLVISLGFFVALDHLGQQLHEFWDVIAFSVVGCGTFAVSIISMPSLKLKHILRILINSLRGNDGLRDECIQNATSLVQGNEPTGKAKRIDQKILVDGMELLQFGFSPDRVFEILSERIEKYTDDSLTIAHWVKNLSKYPPAFGLAGTVLGLVHLMNGLSEGTDPKETGVRMAVALVATLYGILGANVLINPIGDRILANVVEDQNLAEISLKAIVAISMSQNYVETLEELNNFVPSQHSKLTFNVGLLDVA